MREREKMEQLLKIEIINQKRKKISFYETFFIDAQFEIIYLCNKIFHKKVIELSICTRKNVVKSTIIHL